MRLNVRVAGTASQPTTIDGVESSTSVSQLADMVCAAAQLPAAAEQGRKLVHGRSVLRSGTMDENGVVDGAWLVMLPSATPRRDAACSAAPSADSGVPTQAAIRAATASEESVAKEEKAVRDVLRLLSGFFVRPPSEEEGDGAEGGGAGDDAGLQQLQEMGFSENRARRALLLNSGATAAMEWLLQQDFDDAGLDEPLTEEELAVIEKQRSAFMPEPQLVHQLVEMGFELGECDAALLSSALHPQLRYRSILFSLLFSALLLSCCGKLGLTDICFACI
jgi:hypothetical protein